MSESMVEKVAQALAREDGAVFFLEIQADGSPHKVIEAWQRWMPFARAAIAALRKPPENLVTIARRLTETGEVVVTEDDGEEHPVSYHGFDLGALWVAVIDDMLTEETET